MEWTALIDLEPLILSSSEMMMHPGLPPGWVVVVLLCMSALVLLSLRPYQLKSELAFSFSLATVPVIGEVLQRCTRKPWLLLTLRLLMAALFLLVIAAGLMGAPIAERNLATTLTWTIWWTCLIMAIFFTGSAWCAVCPWDAIATWLVRHRLWRRGSETSSLNLRVPKGLRNVFPALFMFVALTWLELGFGITTSPYATAVLALLMIVLTTVSLALFERKAFCRYFCSVGRTIGYYSELSPLALRPVNADVCASCKTLECYHGTIDIEPCPTHLVLGRIKQNTYCTSCGACVQSCPYGNVNWRLRPVAEEAVSTSRPQWDGAWFILGLLALTSFHGITMLSAWPQWMGRLAQNIGDSGQLLWCFTIGMSISMLIPLALYAVMVKVTQWLARGRIEFKRLFALLAIASLPLAFSYHIAHNLSHLLRESRGLSEVLLNPFGLNALPLSSSEIHMRHMNPLLSQDTVFALQAALLVLGFWLALRILQARIRDVMPVVGIYRRWLSMPVLIFLISISLFNLWLLMQPMVMRM